MFLLLQYFRAHLSGERLVPVSADESAFNGEFTGGGGGRTQV